MWWWLPLGCDDPDPVPGIARALSCEPTDRADPPGDLVRVDLDGPATCNDGTPAAMYVRPGAGEHADDWVIVLEGGAWCDSAESCAARWCGEDAYDARKMSSASWGDTRAGEGLLSAEHAFGDWNAALLPYCTSDLWVGTRSRRVLRGDPTYHLAFEGAGVLDQAIEALARGAGELPPLEDADTVVLGGVSAGGYGLAHSLDRIALRLAPVPVHGVLDAVFAPEIEAFDPALREPLEEAVSADYTELVDTWGARLDEGCVSSGDPAWRCADMARIQRDELETSALVNRDLHDPGVREPWAEAGVTQELQDLAVEATLRAWAVETELSLRATACGKHGQLITDPWFAGVAVSDALGGRSYTLEQAVLDHLAGVRVVAVGAADASTSACP